MDAFDFSTVLNSCLPILHQRIKDGKRGRLFDRALPAPDLGSDFLNEWRVMSDAPFAVVGTGG